MRGGRSPFGPLLVFGVILACGMPLQAAETEPLAVAASEPPAIDWSGVGGMSQPDPPDLFEVLQEQQPAPDPVGTGDESDALDDYDPLFDDEFDLDLEDANAGDPFEGFNRGVFSFNETLDSYAWDPITRGYQFVVPAPARRSIHRVFENLESPVIMANQILQLRMRDAGITLGRFVINSTAGAAGLFDPAANGVGWERIEGDFGQTLARYGTPSGAFLMVPLLGPSSVRDLCGDVVDRLMDPLTYLIGPIQWWIVLGTSQGLSEREAYSDELEALEASSVDFYSALRSAYQQSRAAEIRHARGEDGRGPDDPVLSSY